MEALHHEGHEGILQVGARTEQPLAELGVAHARDAVGELLLTRIRLSTALQELRKARDRTIEHGEALDAALEAHESNLEFTLRGGEMLLIDNRRLVHARTAFNDLAGDLGPRQMIRVWMRDEGDAALDG